MSRPAEARIPAVSTPSALTRALLAIADKESTFTERFYEMFFELRPDTRELFGAYPLAEQEEMMRETLRSLATLEEYAETEPDLESEQEFGWLVENLRALGKSHVEYGVTPDMYESYRLVLLDCTLEIVGDQIDERAKMALDEALTRVCDLMNPEADER
jgi:hemoglobin-like flavoprotein